MHIDTTGGIPYIYNKYYHESKNVIVYVTVYCGYTDKHKNTQQ